MTVQEYKYGDAVVYRTVYGTKRIMLVKEVVNIQGYTQCYHLTAPKKNGGMPQIYLNGLWYVDSAKLTPHPNF